MRFVQRIKQWSNRINYLMIILGTQETLHNDPFALQHDFNPNELPQL